MLDQMLNRPARQRRDADGLRAAAAHSSAAAFTSDCAASARPQAGAAANHIASRPGSQAGSTGPNNAAKAASPAAAQTNSPRDQAETQASQATAQVAESAEPSAAESAGASAAKSTESAGASAAKSTESAGAHAAQSTGAHAAQSTGAHSAESAKPAGAHRNLGALRTLGAARVQSAESAESAAEALRTPRALAGCWKTCGADRQVCGMPVESGLKNRRPGGLRHREAGVRRRPDRRLDDSSVFSPDLARGRPGENLPHLASFSEYPAVYFSLIWPRRASASTKTRLTSGWASLIRRSRSVILPSMSSADSALSKSTLMLARMNSGPM
jgi:hypothetical protein